MLGNGRLEGQCFDGWTAFSSYGSSFSKLKITGKKRLCHIRGKMRKKQWVAAGDIILIGLRPFQVVDQ